MMRPRVAALLTIAWLIAGCRSPADPQPLAGGRSVRPLWITTGTAPSNSFRRPLVTSAMVTVGDDRHLYGLDIATGRTRWTLPLPYFVPSYGLVATADSAVTLVSTDGFVVFDLRTGSVRHSWSASVFRNGASELITPQRLSDGRIVYVDRDRMLLRLDPRLGRLDTLVQLPGTVERRFGLALCGVGEARGLVEIVVHRTERDRFGLTIMRDRHRTLLRTRHAALRSRCRRARRRRTHRSVRSVVHFFLPRFCTGVLRTA